MKVIQEFCSEIFQKNKTSYAKLLKILDRDKKEMYRQ